MTAIATTAARSGAKTGPKSPQRQASAAMADRLLASAENEPRVRQGKPHDALDAFVDGFRRASPLLRIDAERAGVPGDLVKAMARSMGISNVRLFAIIGVPKATAEKRAASNTAVSGAPGQAALGVIRLLGMAKAMARNSNVAEADDFDTAKWLGAWIERPQPALGGRKPAEMLDTPTGVETVVKLLGAIESGAYL